MEKKKSTSQIMRQVAGWLYFVLCVFQMLSLYAAWQTGFTGVYNSWLIEMGLMVLYGIGAVYMISGKSGVMQPVRRGIVVATALMVIFALISNQTQLTMYEYFLTAVFPTATIAVIWHVVLLIVRLVLLILAAFFVASSSEDNDRKVYTAGSDEEGGDSEVVNSVTYDYIEEGEVDGEQVIYEEKVTIVEEKEEEKPAE